MRRFDEAIEIATRRAAAGSGRSRSDRPVGLEGWSGFMIASRPNQSQSAVAALIETYRQGFLRLDPALLGSIWDREHDPLVYVAME
jgi:hypothetical protein